MAHCKLAEINIMIWGILALFSVFTLPYSSLELYPQLVWYSFLLVQQFVQIGNVVSLVLAMSELLNKSTLDSISIWLFHQTIFCSVFILYYGCISPLCLREIHHKITSNHLLQLEIGENCSMQPFYHVCITFACLPRLSKNVIWWFRTQTFIDSAHKSTFFCWFHTRNLENDHVSSAKKITIAYTHDDFQF